MGSHVISGTAKALAMKTGSFTEFNESLTNRQPLNAFEMGIKKFSIMLVQITMVLVISIFAANRYLERPVLDSFLFTLAIAIGLTPQLLPSIISLNLAKGAKKMADENVIVKRLDSIENFGSIL